jgi:hypothetical protein
METVKTGTNDIMVFSFAKHSQFKTLKGNMREYDYVHKILSSYLKDYQVDVPKIGFGGYIEDVSAFIAYILKTYQLNKIISGIEISDFDPDEFDPDIEPIILRHDFNSDQEEKSDF